VMSESIVLDVLLILLLIGYLGYGFRYGLLTSIGAIAGVIIGGILAVLAIPLLSGWIPEPSWRIVAVLAVAVLLLVGGQSAGAAIGKALRRRVKIGALRVIDRIAGAGVSVVVAALVVSTLSVSIAALGVPFLTPAIASSTVLRTITDITPDPAKAFLAQVRSMVTEEGLPQIVAALGEPETPPQLPDAVAGTPELDLAAQSVVRITGNAYACGQSQSGSGFVVAADRVITNAHVIAGVSEPVVEVPGKGAKPARVVYFDPVDDLAVLAVNGLDAAPIAMTDTLAVGSAAVANGYPLGGPFVSIAASVISIDDASINNIYGEDAIPRNIYTLAADVQQGDSGGPLLSEAGEVAGVVFAKSAETANLGYAMTMEEVSPVADDAASLTAAVSSGECIAG
jgi:S1-C subfamily serine protease